MPASLDFGCSKVNRQYGWDHPNERLKSEESQRYMRQTLLREVGDVGQKRLRKARVLVVGIGGLGCPLAQYLSAIGVGCLGLVDGDVVELSNLHRQVLFDERRLGEKKSQVAADHLRTQNPHVEIDVFAEHLSYENADTLVSQYDWIADCSDNFFCRYLVNDICVLRNKPFISGAVQQFEGQISFFNYQGGPCYRCLFPAPPPPGVLPNCLQAGVLGVLPGLIGLIQATEIAKAILGIGEVLSGRVLLVDALSMRLREMILGRNPDCPACGQKPRIVDLETSRSMQGEIAPCATLKPANSLLQVSRRKTMFFPCTRTITPLREERE